MQNQSNQRGFLACAAVLMLASGCGGGSGGTASSAPSGTTGKAAATAGIYKGTITSTVSGQATPVVAMVGEDGQTTWMGTDGHVWSGAMPMTGTHFDASLMGRLYAGATFPDGSTAGMWTLHVDHAGGQMSGRFEGAGDTGQFSLMLSSMWDRPATLPTLAGVYTRSTWSGYTMTLAVGSDGTLAGVDSSGCAINGTVSVPDATRNMYAISAGVSSCGVLDGNYSGQGTLLDASAMQDWMSAMHPLEQGGRSHGSMSMGGGMGGGMGGMSYNTVPGGSANLFMFVLKNDQNAIMDALAR